MVTNDITAIYADRDNDIWISQFKGDVLRYTPQTDSYVRVNLQFVNTFIEKDAQTLFAGTRSGLYQIIGIIIRWKRYLPDYRWKVV